MRQVFYLFTLLNSVLVLSSCIHLPLRNHGALEGLGQEDPGSIGGQPVASSHSNIGVNGNKTCPNCRPRAPQIGQSPTFKEGQESKSEEPPNRDSLFAPAQGNQKRATDVAIVTFCIDCFGPNSHSKIAPELTARLRELGVEVRDNPTSNIGEFKIALNGINIYDAQERDEWPDANQIAEMVKKRL